MRKHPLPDAAVIYNPCKSFVKHSVSSSFSLFSSAALIQTSPVKKTPENLRTFFFSSYFSCVPICRSLARRRWTCSDIVIICWFYSKGKKKKRLPSYVKLCSRSCWHKNTRRVFCRLRCCASWNYNRKCISKWHENVCVDRYAVLFLKLPGCFSLFALPHR